VTQKTNLPKYRLVLAVFFYHFSIAFVLSLIFYLIFISPFLMVKEVIVKGDEGVDVAAIKVEVDKQLLGKRFVFLRKDHLFWVPAVAIKKDILDKFKNVNEAQVERKFPDKLRVTATIKSVTVVFCGNERCTALDKEGTAIDVFPLTDLSRYGGRFVLVRDESGSVTEAGRGINTAVYVDFASNVKKYLEENNRLKINDIFSPLIFASELKLKMEEGWLLLVDVKMPLLQLSETLKVILAKEIGPENRVCLEYLDLRIPKRVYYKYFDDCEELKKNKNQTQEQSQGQGQGQDSNQEERQEINLEQVQIKNKDTKDD
jgi:cell division septal protein FtsQ